MCESSKFNLVKDRYSDDKKIVEKIKGELVERIKRGKIDYYVLFYLPPNVVLFINSDNWDSI